MDSAPDDTYWPTRGPGKEARHKPRDSDPDMEGSMGSNLGGKDGFQVPADPDLVERFGDLVGLYMWEKPNEETGPTD